MKPMFCKIFSASVFKSMNRPLGKWRLCGMASSIAIALLDESFKAVPSAWELQCYSKILKILKNLFRILQLYPDHIPGKLTFLTLRLILIRCFSDALPSWCEYIFGKPWVRKVILKRLSFCKWHLKFNWIGFKLALSSSTILQIGKLQRFQYLQLSKYKANRLLSALRMVTVRLAGNSGPLPQM